MEIQPQRGTTVVKISVRKMMEARFVREAIETAVVAAPARPSTSRAGSGSTISWRCRSKQLGGTITRPSSATTSFSTSRWPRARAAPWRGRRFRTSRPIWTGCASSPSPAPSVLPLIDQHRAIMAAIDSRDEEAAAEAMRRHLAICALPRVEAEHPELFSS